MMMIIIIMIMIIIIIIIIIPRLRSRTKYDMALINHTKFLKFMLLNQSRHVSDEPSSIVSCTE